MLFDERFGTDDGKAHLVPAEWLPAKELPDEEYPFVLNTGRLLEHWHTGSMTRRSYALDAIQPEAARLHATRTTRRDWASPTATSCASRSRRGSIELRARLSHRDTPGTCFIPFHFREAAANVLTIDEIDPIGQDPRVQVLRGEDRAGGQRRGTSPRRPREGGVASAANGRPRPACASRVPGHRGARRASSPGRA